MTGAEISDYLASHEIRWSAHAVRGAGDDALDRADVIAALAGRCEVIESYPDDPRGPSCLGLTRLQDGSPVHIVLGHGVYPWMVITVYRPDPEKWDADFRIRRR